MFPPLGDYSLCCFLSSAWKLLRSSFGFPVVQSDKVNLVPVSPAASSAGVSDTVPVTDLRQWFADRFCAKGFLLWPSLLSFLWFPFVFLPAHLNWLSSPQRKRVKESHLNILIQGAFGTKQTTYPYLQIDLASDKQYIRKQWKIGEGKPGLVALSELQWRAWSELKSKNPRNGYKLKLLANKSDLERGKHRWGGQKAKGGTGRWVLKKENGKQKHDKLCSRDKACFSWNAALSRALVSGRPNISCLGLFWWQSARNICFPIFRKRLSTFRDAYEQDDTVRSQKIQRIDFDFVMSCLSVPVT